MLWLRRSMLNVRSWHTAEPHPDPLPAHRESGSDWCYCSRACCRTRGECAFFAGGISSVAVHRAPFVPETDAIAARTRCLSSLRWGNGCNFGGDTTRIFAFGPFQRILQIRLRRTSERNLAPWPLNNPTEIARQD